MRAGHGIGAVVAALSEEFEDISISKVRYLEAQGLVTPERTAAGYRVFSDDDVARLRHVLRAQRERYLPLRVIRQELDAIDRGVLALDGDARDTGATADPATPATEASGGDTSLPVPDLGLLDLTRPNRLRMTREELAARVGLSTAQVRSLADHGLISPDRCGHHDEDDVAVATAAAALMTFGIEPRHLRPFRTAADREATLVDHAVQQQERRAEVAAEVARQCMALHVALVRQALRGD